MKSIDLVLDLGNTRLKAGLFSENELLQTETIEHTRFDELLAVIKNKHLINRCILSSVAQHAPVLDSIQEFQPLFFSADTPVPIVNAYSTPSTLGRDRLANAVFAALAFPGENAVVIDAGTCLKFDMVDQSGRYLGGSIGPGLNMRYKALHTFTDRLPLLKTSTSNPVIGKSTEESIHAGVFEGMKFEMNALMQWYNKQYPGIRFCLTGGDSSLFAEGLNFPIFADPNLTLKGLHHILNHNA